MNGKKIVILLYCLLVLSFTFTLQPSSLLSPYESGRTTISLQILSQARNFEQQGQIFNFNSLRKYSNSVEVILTIAGFHFNSSLAKKSAVSTLSEASLVGWMQNGQELKISSKHKGGLVRLQINYLIMEHDFVQQMQMLLLDNQNKNNQYWGDSSMFLSVQQELIEIEQPKLTNYQLENSKNVGESSGVKMVHLLSTLAVQQGQIVQLLDVRIIIHQEKMLIKVGIPSEPYLQGIPLVYKLLLIKSSQSIHSSNEKYIKIVNKFEYINSNRSLILLNFGKAESLIFGLIGLKNNCSSLQTLRYQRSDSTHIFSATQTHFQKEQCTYTIHFVGLELATSSTQEIVPARLLATTCTGRTFYGHNNFTYLATVSQPKPGYPWCPSWNWWCKCEPCPIGCSVCSSLTCGSMYISCSNCSTGFTKLPLSGNCSGQTYCSCPNGTYPDVSQTCKNCTVIIPNCLSCSSTYYYGTYCASCNIGYYPTYVSATSGYARGCAACSAGCKNCTSSASCITCINNLVVINSTCTCNTSQSSYYNSNTSSCTSCSIAITNCLNCSLSGLITSCTQCKTGNYLDSTTKTCIACSTYCSVCTASGCTTCISTTLTVNGTNCVCISPLFLNTSSSPPSCSACNNFQPNCLTCNSSSGSVLCQTCQAGFYPSPSPVPGVCIACVANCLSCVDNSSCSTCKTNFTYNPITFLCQCSPGFVSYGTNSCVQCSYLIHGCQSCGPNGLYCATCANPYYNSSLNGTTCSLCPLQCSSCTSPGTGSCGGCITGYDLVGGNCVCTNCSICATNTSIAYCSTCSGTTCYSCSVGYYFNSTNNNCTICPLACSSCTSATTCTTCNSPFIYISPNCVCNNALLYYYNPGTQSCTTSCGSIYVNCTSCTGQVASGSVSSTECTACVNGTYLFNSTTCTPCPPTCLQCSSATNCSSCPPTFYIINGVCDCDTNSQYYLNATSNKCQFCNTILPNCSICQVNTSTSSKVGCFECDYGYYINATDQCTLCPQTCVSCTSSTTCTSCKNTYSMINGSCICDASKQLYDTGSECQPCYTFVDYCTQCADSGNVICASCVAGTYLNSPSNTSCLLCPSNCNQCDSTGCLTCILGFLPVSGVCVFTNDCSNYLGVDPNCASCNSTNIANSTSTICEGCLTGYYLVDNISCLPCPSTCQSCSSYSVCLVCSPTFTYIDGVCTCDALSNQVLNNSKCVSCGSLLPSCLTCNSTATPVVCTGCLPTYYLNSSGICVQCPSGCTTCYQNNSCTQCKPGFIYNSIALTCTDSALCSSTQYFNGSICTSCPSGCSSCVDSLTCIACDLTYSLIDGICQCDAQQSMFYSAQSLTCNQCGNYNSTNYGIDFTLNCLTCINSNTYTLAGFQCLICKTGYYVSSGLCLPCQEGCNDCTAINNCIKCTAPQYILNSTGGCECNQMINYFQNGTQCDLCTLENCTICLSISICQNCTPGSFVNSTTRECQPQICGNSRREGTQECDDGNRIDGDGCNFYCNFEQYFVCTNLVEGQLSVCQPQSNKFKLQLAEQTISCNKITLKLLNVGSQSISHCDITNLMPSYQFPYTKLQSHSIEDKYITYEFSYNQTIQNQTFNLIFDPTALCIANSISFPPFNISTVVSPTNNQLAMYYQQSLCTKQSTAQNVVNTIKYVSYATLALSALPSKIVGLQLFGVLQLSYLSIGSMDNVNMLLEPLSSLGSVNGYQFDLGNDKAASRLLQFIPQRINAIDYKANFLRNCNVMFLLVAAVIVVSFIMYLISRLCFSCTTFTKVTKRLSKEVLLTLILFNQLNFAYSAGLHFRYAPKEDPLYFMGTIVAICTLVIPVVMAIALLISQEQGFGQFKDKLKPGCVQRGYFVVTLVYRMGIGLYMASANENPLSTLIILAFSILFLVYNLVNLPFTKAYHNYRANICHLTQFVILFVAMYYRSIKGTTSATQTSSIFSPVYLEYILIIASLVASLLVLAYQIYLFIKQCCSKKEDQQQAKETEDQNMPNQSMNKLNQRDITIIKVEEIQKINTRVETLGPIYDQYS